jgi:hypothetical protein
MEYSDQGDKFMTPNLPTGETMSEGTDVMPPELMAMPAANEQRVPVAALQQPDDQEQLVTPEVGDIVSYTVEGRVTRIEGDTAIVTVESANGQPIQSDAPAEMPEAGGLEALENEAKGMVI